MKDFLEKYKVPEETQRFVDKSIEIGEEIISVLHRKGLNQKDLANMLNKSEPEISRWLSGTHNFTLKTLAKIEAVLGEDLIITPTRSVYKYFIYRTTCFQTETAGAIAKPEGLNFQPAELDKSVGPNKKEVA